MTVQKDVTKNIYVGNGSTRTFPFTFECPAEHPEYIKVYLMQDDGTALATSDYQLDMDARQITYPSSGTALPEGKKLVIMRELPLQQMMNLVNNGPYFAEDVELAFDENVMAMQQIAEKLNRSIIMSVDIDGDAFVNEVPFEAGKSFRIADDGKSIVLTEDPAKVLPLAQSKLEATTAQANIAAAKAAAAAESESEANSYAENAKEYAATATTKVIEATDEANRAKAEADRAKSISENIGNPVSDVTENNGTVTVTKSNGTQSTFMAFPRGENGALPIADGGTGATTAGQACANIGALPTSGGNITGSLSIGGYVVVPCYSNAAAHNAIFRGKYLGNHVTDEQWAAIKAGIFDDLYIGDYWTIGGVDYVIAAFNYYLNTCWSPTVTANHVTIVPRKNMYTHVMNDTNVTTGAYVGSKMYSSGLNSAKTTIANAFGSAHILTIRQFFQNGVTDNYETSQEWYDASVWLMSEFNVYGALVWKNAYAGTNWRCNYTIDNSQYPVFAYDKTMIHTHEDYWLRDVAGSGYFARVSSYGHCDYDYASNADGVRPAFNIYQS